METIRIKNIKTSWSNKDGQPYLAKQSGRPYAMVMIETENETSLGGKRISGFANAGDPHLNWQIGGEYQVGLEKSKDGKYINFRVPQEKFTKTGFDHEAWMKRMEAKVDEVLGILETQDTGKAGEIKPEDINFK